MKTLIFLYNTCQRLMFPLRLTKLEEKSLFTDYILPKGDFLITINMLICKVLDLGTINSFFFVI